MAIADDRQVVEAALESVVPDEIEDFVVTGWVVVVERMTPDGRPWLMVLDDERSPKWKRDGMLHEALYGDWSDSE